MVPAASVASRRDEILRATLRLLGSRGPAAVTHRAVAAEAGVPLAATTYYFDSKAELLREAFALQAAEEVERLEAARAALQDAGPMEPGAVAQAIAHVLVDQVGALAAVAKFEAYLEATRDEDLREPAARTLEVFVALAEQLLADWGHADPAHAARVAVATIDGLLLQELVTTGGAPDVERLAAGVTTVLEALRPH